MAYRQEQVVFGLSQPFATSVFTVKITKMEKTKSQAGNPMIRTECEISDPVEVTSSGTKIQVGGMPFVMFGMLDPTAAYGLGKLIGALQRAGLDPKEVQGLPDDVIFDEDNLKPFVGKFMKMTLACKPRLVMREPTPAEAKAGVKRGPLKDAQGNDIVNGYTIDADWQNVLGPGTSPEGW